MHAFTYINSSSLLFRRVASCIAGILCLCLVIISFETGAMEKAPPPPSAHIVEAQSNYPHLISWRRTKAAISAIGLTHLLSHQQQTTPYSLEEVIDQRPYPPDSHYRRGRSNALSPNTKHQDILQVIRQLPRAQEKALFAVLSDPEKGALILLLSQNPRFTVALKSFKNIPEELGKGYAKHHHRAFSALPSSYRVTSPSDVDRLALSASLTESMKKVIYERNPLWITHLLINIGLIGVTAVASTSQGVLVNPVLFEGAVASVIEDNMRAVCANVAQGNRFSIQGPLTGPFTQRTTLRPGHDVAATAIGTSIALIPPIGQKLVMPLIVAGTNVVLKITMRYKQRLEHSGHEQEAISQLSKTIEHLERVQDINPVVLLGSQGVNEMLTAIARNPSQTLYIASALAELPVEEREQMMSILIEVAASFDKPDDNSGSCSRLLHRILQIDPEPDNRPSATGLANAIYHLLYNRKMAYVYVPLLIGITGSLMIHISAVMAVGTLSPHIGLIGSSVAVIAQPGSLNATCAAFNFTGNQTATAVLTGSVESISGSSFGTFLNILAIQGVNLAMSGIYWPCQRLCSSIAGCFRSCLQYCHGKQKNTVSAEGQARFEERLQELQDSFQFQASPRPAAPLP